MKQLIRDIYEDIFDANEFEAALAAALIERLNYDALADTVLEAYSDDDLMQIALDSYTGEIRD